MTYIGVDRLQKVHLFKLDFLRFYLIVVLAIGLSSFLRKSHPACVAGLFIMAKVVKERNVCASIYKTINLFDFFDVRFFF